MLDTPYYASSAGGLVSSAALASARSVPGMVDPATGDPRMRIMSLVDYGSGAAETLLESLLRITKRQEDSNGAEPRAIPKYALIVVPTVARATRAGLAALLALIGLATSLDVYLAFVHAGDPAARLREHNGQIFVEELSIANRQAIDARRETAGLDPVVVVGNPVSGRKRGARGGWRVFSLPPPQPPPPRDGKKKTRARPPTKN